MIHVAFLLLLLVIPPALLRPVVGGSLRQRPVWEASWLRERPAEAPVASREATGHHPLAGRSRQAGAGAVVLGQSWCGPAVSDQARTTGGLWWSDTQGEGGTAHCHGTLTLYSGQKSRVGKSKPHVLQTVQLLVD